MASERPVSARDAAGLTPLHELCSTPSVTLESLAIVLGAYPKAADIEDEVRGSATVFFTAVFMQYISIYAHAPFRRLLLCLARWSWLAHHL